FPGEHRLERPDCIEIDPHPSLRLASSVAGHRPRGDAAAIPYDGGGPGGPAPWGISLLHDVKQPAALAQRKRYSSTLDTASALAGARSRPLGSAGLGSGLGLAWGLVEPDGIEPTTSCLQSRRSPN